MNRSWNRQLNAALNRIAFTQLRLDGLCKTYVAKRTKAGDTKTEAIRCLKRRLARIVYNALKPGNTAAAKAQLLPAA